MFFMMPYWHLVGEQNLTNEAYKVKPEAHVARAEAMVEQYQVREEGDTGIEVVHPPAGSDVYLVARLWEWWPILELEKDQTYRVHLSSADWMHGFSLQPTNLNVQVHPGYDFVVTLTPNQSGEFAIVCNEFCGIGHHTMLGKIYVVEK
jgi:cytochrome c oxidase subunit 2